MEIILQYHLPEKLTTKDLDFIIDISSSIKKGIPNLEKWEGLSIDYYLSQNNKPSYTISIYGLEDKVKPITYHFLQNVGIPNFVRGDCNFIEDFLRGNGKKLQRKFNGAWVGKHIVDKKSKLKTPNSFS